MTRELAIESEYTDKALETINSDPTLENVSYTEQPEKYLRIAKSLTVTLINECRTGKKNSLRIFLRMLYLSFFMLTGFLLFDHMRLWTSIAATIFGALAVAFFFSFRECVKELIGAESALRVIGHMSNTQSFDLSRGYTRGIITTPRNASCPCGSGKKYKHCCGKPT